MSKTDPKKLLQHGLHLGHKKNKVHPKAQTYIHSYQKGTSIIDLIQTSEYLDEAKKFVSGLSKDGKNILFVATKKAAREPVSRIAREHGISHMTNKWVGGFLTNFAEISKNIELMKKLKDDQKAGAWRTLPKHEQVQLEKQINKMSSIYAGVESLEKLPDALFIIDIKKEKNALTEALRLHIPVIAVVDTNVNPQDVTYPIPGNDDAISSIEYIAQEIADAYAKKAEKKAEK